MANRIGKYRLKKTIGQGMTSKVMLAEHEVIKTDLALKVFKPDLFKQNPGYYKLVVAEISILKEL